METKCPPLVFFLFLYLGVGSIATAIHYAIFLALIEAELADPVSASICGSMVGAIASFIGNRAHCFKADGSRVLQPIRFTLVALAANLGNGVGIWVLIKLSFSPLIAQALVTIALTALGFIAHRFWTFSHADIKSVSRAP